MPDNNIASTDQLAPADPVAMPLDTPPPSTPLKAPTMADRIAYLEARIAYLELVFGWPRTGAV